MYCHQLHCSLGNPEQSFQVTSSAVQNSAVWSSPLEYIHMQCSTVIWRRAMQFGAMMVVTCNELAILYGAFQLNPG